MLALVGMTNTSRTGGSNSLPPPGALLSSGAPPRAQSGWLGYMHPVAFMESVMVALALPAGPLGTAVSIAGWAPA